VRQFCRAHFGWEARITSGLPTIRKLMTIRAFIRSSVDFELLICDPMFVNGFERTMFSRIWLKPLPTQFDSHRLGLDEVNFHRLLQVAILWI